MTNGSGSQSHGPSDPSPFADPEATDSHNYEAADSTEFMQSDEEKDSTGWVRKKVNKVNSALHRTATSRNGVSAKPAWEESSVGLSKSLGYFRVNLGKLSSHTEYQILAFTGGPILSARERQERKEISSTIVR